LKHIARKRFGQHFLVDQSVIEDIITVIAPKGDDLMVEIGPGMGAMTGPLLEKLGKLCVVELDKDLVDRLKQNPLLKVVSGDVLKVEFSALADELLQDKLFTKTGTIENAGQRERDCLRVVGNLPYNISTPILFHLLDYVDRIKDQHFMLQKEVVDRMIAKPCTSDYGRLSVMLQWRYDMASLVEVPPDAFDPPPRVKSAVVRMTPRKSFERLRFDVFQTIVQVSFSQRRKLLRHTLGHWLEERYFGGQFDLKRRAEEVPVHEYIALAGQFTAL
jgi:16S rRNA (adenine1518-N6/adenine1519-N6)-dimethyltransferase